MFSLSMGTRKAQIVAQTKHSFKGIRKSAKRAYKMAKKELKQVYKSAKKTYKLFKKKFKKVSTFATIVVRLIGLAYTGYCMYQAYLEATGIADYFMRLVDIIFG